MLFRDADTGGKTVSTSKEVMPLDIVMPFLPCAGRVGWRKGGCRFQGVEMGSYMAICSIIY